jgi:flagellar protein FliO/FliZ
MNMRLVLISLLGLAYQTTVFASTESVVVSPTGSILKMVMGLAVVLAVMALLSWLVKRLLPNAAGGQHSVVKMVGGVSVGSRERVVVLEVAGRWLVVGVAQGQVSAIANLDIGSDALAETIGQGAMNTQANNNAIAHTVYANPIVKPFSEWLKKSAQNMKNKG